MKKAITTLCLLLLLCSVCKVQAALAGPTEYIGEWACVYIDIGDGNKKTEYEGVSVSDLMKIQINQDGTLLLTSADEVIPGTWAENPDGIAASIDGQEIPFAYNGQQLVNESDSLTVYLEKSRAKAGGLISLLKRNKYAGTWKAVRYETMGYTFDINMLFPDGCKLILREDGTGEVSITRDYTEKITWQDMNGSLSIAGSYVFSSPTFDKEKAELKMFYGSDTVTVIFQKSIGEPQEPKVTEATPAITIASETTPELTPEPTPEVTAVPALDAGECKTTLFAAQFPEGAWIGSDSWRSDSENYCAVKYEKKDQSGTVIASVAITANSENVDSYRSKIKTLLEYAKKVGKEQLEKVTISSIVFSGVDYENWGWNYKEYAARVPESRITINITLEQPENIGEDLQPILDSIVYHLPVLTPPNVDPPMPEDGTPYQPSAASVSIGDKTLSASWLKTPKSIVLDSIFDNHLAISGSMLYVLAGDKIYTYTLKGGTLTPDLAMKDGFLQLSDDFDYLSAGGDGIIYACEGIFNILAVKDGTVVQDNDLSGNLAMHPSGEWGISFWANAEPKLVQSKNGVLTEVPWVLANLSDAEKRQGRFSMVSCVSISEKRIYVSGTDAEKGNAHRVAVYDLSGTELFTFGAEDWTADDAFGSITGIVETQNGILVEDGNYRAFKLFSHEGEFLGSVDSDMLLGTDYPWLSSMISYSDGVLVAAAQARKDGSCDELLIFEIKGF